MPRGIGGNKKGGPNKPAPPFITQLFLAVMVFALVSIVFDTWFMPPADNEISISETASLVTEGRVQSITVQGEALTITLTPNEANTESETRVSKKEAGTALSDTLVNYGVSTEALQAMASS